MEESKREFRSAVVWLFSGLTLTTYCLIGLLGKTVPGVEQLVAHLSLVEGSYIYLAGFLAIFIEGLYVVGNFFPGTTLVTVLALLSQVGGVGVFFGTIVAIFLGWSLASVVNILLAKTYHTKISKLEANHNLQVSDRLWATWFPAFRANYEVAQVAEGAHPLKVLLSSIRVKIITTTTVALGALLVPLFVDIKQVSNEEGFLTVALVALISLTVGTLKLRKHFQQASPK